MGLGRGVAGQEARCAHGALELAFGCVEAAVVRIPLKDVLDAVAVGALVETLDALEALLDPGDDMIALVFGHDVELQSEGFEPWGLAKAEQRFALVEVGLYAFRRDLTFHLGGYGLDFVADSPGGGFDRVGLHFAVVELALEGVLNLEGTVFE